MTAQESTTVASNSNASSTLPRIPREKLGFSDIFTKQIPDFHLLRNHLYREGRLLDKCVLKMFKMTTKLLRKEDNVLEIQEPVIMVGDIHGQFYDLLRLLELGRPLDEDNPSRQYLFLGDYVDRGMFGMECMLIICALKIGYPNQMHLLRGNHECRHLTNYFSFRMECLHKYNEKIYNACMELFDHLPLAAIVNKQFFCVHGGLSPRIKYIHQIEKIDRFHEPSKRGDAMTDLMWSDPARNYGQEPIRPITEGYHFTFNNFRNISFFYSYTAVCEFLKNNDLLSIIRAHEAKDAGFQMYKKSTFSKFPSLVSIFSAPNYCDTYGNKAVILCLEKGQLNVKTFLASYHPFCLPNFENGLIWSLPFAADMVTRMLLSVCKLCTQEELEEMGECDSEEVIHNRVLLNKIKAISRMHRYYLMVSEENGLIAQLKGGLSGHKQLPAGTLSRSRASLEIELIKQNKKLSFDQARKLDVINEAMPKTKFKSNKAAEGGVIMKDDMKTIDEDESDLSSADDEKIDA